MTQITYLKLKIILWRTRLHLNKITNNSLKIQVSKNFSQIPVEKGIPKKSLDASLT